MMPKHTENPSDFKKTPSTMIDVLTWRAEREPDRIAYVFLSDGEYNETSITYGELYKQVKAIAAMLQNNHKVGERCLLIYPPGLEFLAAFFGCLYAGVVAVPVYPPRKDKDMIRILAVLTNSGCSSVMTISSILERFEKIKSDISIPELDQLQWLVSDQTEELKSLTDQWINLGIKGNDLAFLQYTSGSTGRPKGVMISHGNLIYNQRMLVHSTAHSKECVLVTWLPLYHDMGLIGNIMHPLYIGFKCIFMSPEAFLQKPFRWLDAISRYKATTTGGAPNFAFDFCVHRIASEQRAQLDLSSWEFALVGSDTVRQNTLERFIEAFGPYGFRRETFYPAFGLAEATLIVSGGEKKADPIYFSVDWDALTQHQVQAALPNKKQQVLVGCGKTMLDQEIKIVDPHSLRECSPDKIGEIWVSGENIAQGYWNNEELSKKILKARIEGNHNETFLRTGDLGFLREGELYITGRVKNLIVIRGRNHYPHDIEATAEASVTALRAGCSAAFTIEDQGEEKLVIVAELERRFLSERRRLGGGSFALDNRNNAERRKFNVDDRGFSQADPELALDECIGSIKQAIAKNHGLQIHAIVLIRPVSLPKTTSGKIRRLDCREQFLNKKLIVIKEWIDQSRNTPEGPANTKQVFNAEAIQSWLLSRLAKEFKLARHQINPGTELFRYGLDSLAAVSISGELEEWIGRSVSPTVFYNYPSIKAISQHLARDVQAITLSDEDGTEQSRFGMPVAIVGAACRFPGANSIAEFWQLLQNSGDAITEIPPERWGVQDHFDARRGQPGKMNTRWGGFIKDIDQFDPFFFGISPREAAYMDPQQRILLEISWEAIENAGINIEHLIGSNTGVFVGISNNEYSRLSLGSDKNLNAYQGTGNALSIAANRISYHYDFRGPSIAVDTACSSSLVSVHMACQSLRTGESDLAIAGGINLLLTPEPTIIFSQADMMASDGHCKTFDAAADGYVRSEGCGLVVLKLLPDAMAAGDNVLAVIKGSAVNQDGRSNGITAPNGPSQQAVITKALQKADVKPSQVDFIEAHGTGTSLGDPIEVDSLKAVFMQDRLPDKPCLIGSVKTNIGHLESAAGIAGLLKTALAVHHAAIPGNLHFKSLNPHISLEDTSFTIPVSSQSWPGDGKNRIAGVSSFGFGGTNAHMIIESQESEDETDNVGFAWQLFTLSAKSEVSLNQLIVRHLDVLERSKHESFVNYCYTVNHGRAHFNHRLAIACDSMPQLIERLRTFVSQDSKEYTDSVLQQDVIPRIAFIFPSRCSCNSGVAKSLYELHSVFKAGIDQCEEVINYLTHTSLISLLTTDKIKDNGDGEFSHLLTFAVEYSLAKLWVSWGIVPDILIGSGVGEIVAATLADVFDLEMGLKLAAYYDQKSDDVSGFYAQHPTLPILSGETGQNPLENGGKDLSYWQSRSETTPPEMIEHLESEGYHFSVMMGPYPATEQEKHPQNSPHCLPSLDSEKDDWQQLIETLGDLYVSGVNIDWIRFYSDFKGLKKLELPNYPFQKKSYWIEGVKAFVTPPSTRIPNHYEVAWQPTETGTDNERFGADNHDAGFWLIFADNTGVGPQLSANLNKQKQPTVLVYPGNDYDGKSQHHFEIVPSNPDHFDRLLDEAGSRLGSCLGIIHLWSLNDRCSTTLDLDDLTSTIRLSSFSALHLIQAISRKNQIPVKGMWLITSNTHFLDSDASQPICAAQRALWGLGKGIALEYPDINLSLIDIEKATPEASTAVIQRELVAPSGEWQVAYRKDNRFVARLIPKVFPDDDKPTPFTFNDRSTYLITGGLGKIGLHVAKFLVDRGVKQLALLGRSGLPDAPSRSTSQEAAASIIQSLENAGATIKIYQADASDSVQMKKVIGDIESSQSEIKGIFHAAGTVSKNTISGLTEQEFSDVLKSKFEGACILHNLSLSMDLDCFVLFSSISAVWGSRHIAHYAAANAFLDGLADFRKSQNLPILSINWGPWAEGGMTTTDEQTQMARLGINALSPETSLRVLHDSLTHQKSSLIVVSANWQRLKSLYETIGYGNLFAEIPLQSDHLEKDSTGPISAEAGNRGAWLNRLHALNNKEKAAQLFELIKLEIAKIMRCQPSEINTDAGFIDLGLDSLMAVELKDILEQQLNLSLDATLIFDYPNLKALIEILLILLEKGEGYSVKPVAEPEPLVGTQQRDKHAPQIEELSDDEVAKLIEKEIEDM